MFGCLRRLGCLFVLLLAVVGYLTRGYWWAPARAVVGRTAGMPVAADTVSRWEPLSPGAAERGERQLRTLAAPSGPVYVSLRPGDLASYAFLSLSSTLPALAQDAQATVVGDRMYVRSVVSLRDFAGAIGSVGRLVHERDTLRLGGTFEVPEPGRAIFHVQDVQIGSFPLPERMIPPLVRRLAHGAPRAGTAPDAIELRIPEYIADARVARGRITLYKRH